MKIKGKKITVVLGVICALNLMAAGCGAGSNETVGAGAEAEATSTDSASGEKDVIGEEGTAEETDITGKAENGTNTAGTEPSGTAETSRNPEGRWHVLAPDVAAVVDADFMGTVIKTDADTFYIVEEQMEILEDGSLCGSSVSAEAQIPDSDLVQVVFEEDTRFYIRTIYENGARYEDSEASFKDLIQNMSVEMKGEFAEDIFHAKEVRMVKIG